ncbi:hypothetical protein ckrop_0137 [Corynebacterium kroppenstedtii DSM 44385]|uniref:Uncharacterized protein n=1 Tax=Corynebacterium kroppenstedtii (strain DSM 44385 / JCM 11950 / CIP 105744 / CCUG 35717) TaxID=645127 RepID=C4LG81_CORK4|nr:hypothetical protein ckrop_0137 [Corynebacterium kroppenstedtii DSM 44385]
MVTEKTEESMEVSPQVIEKVCGWRLKAHKLTALDLHKAQRLAVVVLFGKIHSLFDVMLYFRPHLTFSTF